LSIETLVAPVDDHVSTEEPPLVIEAGEAENVTVGAAPTVTVAVAVVDPDALVAVMRYVVVAVGFTVRVPEAATVPIPLSIETPVAPVDDHVSTEEPPLVIDEGEAESVTVGAEGVEDVARFTLQEAVGPAAFRTVMVAVPAVVIVPAVALKVAPVPLVGTTTCAGTLIRLLLLVTDIV
jgi:hypothetical protein